MEHIDWGNRWIYKGSKTQPPCDQFVYWNVIKTIFPIQKSEIDAYKRKLNQIGINTEGTKGNWREIQKGFNRDVMFITSSSLKLGLHLLSLLMVASYTMY